MMAIDPAPHVIGRHSSKTALNANWAQVAALEDRVEVLEASPGSSAFTDLTDTPSAYTGSALKVVRVNAAETALEFATSAGGGDMLAANNLSDLADKATARTNLGVEIGSDVQAYDADLTTWAGVTRAAGFDTFVATPSSANLASLVTGETGSGALVFGTSPGFTTAANPVSNDGAALGTTALKWSDLFLADGGVINWNNGDVAIVHSTDALTFSGAGSGYLFDNFVAPSVNDGAVLGSTSLKWSDLFLASGAVINFNAGDVLITHSSNLLAFTGASSGYTFDATISVGSNTTLSSGALLLNLANSGIELGSNTSNTPFIDFHSSANTIDYDVRLIASGGSASIGTGTLTVNASGGVAFTGAPLPSSSDGAALGSASLMWSDLFLASGAVLNFNNGNYTLTHSAGLLTASGALSIGTANAFTCGTIELGAASDTTLSRSSAGVLAVEGVTVSMNSTAATHTAGTIELGNASDTTIARSAAGTVTIEGGQVLLNNQTATISKGFNLTPYSIGTFAATFTPDPANGNYQYGTHDSTNITSFNVPGSDCAIDILITNSGTAGSIAFSGSYSVSSNTGDTFTTTTGHKFIVSIRRINGVSTYFVKALQ